jgi:phosphoglycolate phosphatase-like HAD superfamily hydrolase
MESAIISGKSKKDIRLLIAIAEKMGIKAKFLTGDDLEDIGMAKAIKEGETGELINTEEFLRSIK